MSSSPVKQANGRPLDFSEHYKSDGSGHWKLDLSELEPVSVAPPDGRPALRAFLQARLGPGRGFDAAPRKRINRKRMHAALDRVMDKCERDEVVTPRLGSRTSTSRDQDKIERTSETRGSFPAGAAGSQASTRVQVQDAKPKPRFGGGIDFRSKQNRANDALYRCHRGNSPIAWQQVARAADAQPDANLSDLEKAERDAAITCSVGWVGR